MGYFCTALCGPVLQRPYTSARIVVARFGREIFWTDGQGSSTIAINDSNS